MHFLPSLTILTLTSIGFQLFNSPVTALNVTSINNCPVLPTRESSPINAQDVRIGIYTPPIRVDI